MDVIYFILLLLGALCFLAAATGRASVGDNGQRAVGLLPLGLLFFISVALIEAGRVVFD